MVYWLVSAAIVYALIGFSMVVNEEWRNRRIWFANWTDATILIVWTLFAMVAWPLLLWIGHSYREWPKDDGQHEYLRDVM